MRLGKRTRRVGVVGVVVLAAAAASAALIVRDIRVRARATRIRAVNVEAVCPDARPLGPTCSRCIAAFCCAEMKACYEVPDCIDLNDCYVRSGEDEGKGGSPTTRADACLKQHAGAIKSFLAWDHCARKNCEDVCPRGPEED